MPKGWKAGPVVVSAEYRCHRGAPGYLPLDIANAQAATKAAIDGFIDAGIAPNDTKRWLTWGQFDLVTRKGQKPAGVTFTFEANP
jgi:hypothetical protein